MINTDAEFELLNKRFYDGICREKFNRDIPYNNTPSNIPSVRKFYFYENEKKIFVVYSTYLFDKIIQIFWLIAKETENKNQEPLELIKKCFNEIGVQNLISSYSWSKDFDRFYEVLVEESFFYFDDLQYQYYVNLFRCMSKDQFKGGLLHSLTRHFSDFNKYCASPNGEVKFDYGSLMANIILCSINGDEVKKEEGKSINDYKITKRIKVGSKYLYVTLYWDDRKEMFIFTSASIRNK